MQISDTVDGCLKAEFQLEFEKEIAVQNIDRGRRFAMAIILIEVTLLLANLHFSHAAETFQSGFRSSSYGLMYGITIIVTGIYLYVGNCLKGRVESEQRYLALIKILMISYLTFIMAWSAVITLLDQRLYGNVSAYLIALVLGSIVFYLNSRMLFIPYLVSLSILLIGLPYFQSSPSILIGHYVNVGIFVILSWVLTQTLYDNSVKNFASRWEIENKNTQLSKINRRLTDEIVLREHIQAELEDANQDLKRLSLMDDLTGIPNRRSLDNYLSREWNRAIREGNSISLLMIDIDYFKAFNDNYGHSRGDDILIKVAQTISSHSRRSSDFVARLGGEEFLFITVNMDEEATRSLAEKIRNSIQNLNIVHAYSKIGPYLTISIGITIVRPSLNDNPAASINKADRALYSAKLAGRNRVAASL